LSVCPLHCPSRPPSPASLDCWHHPFSASPFDPSPTIDCFFFQLSSQHPSINLLDDKVYSSFVSPLYWCTAPHGYPTSRRSALCFLPFLFDFFSALRPFSWTPCHSSDSKVWTLPPPTTPFKLGFECFLPDPNQVLHDASVPFH